MLPCSLFLVWCISFTITTLGIENLCEVIQILKDNHFPSNEYFDLSLNLGLFHNTITEIEEKRSSPKARLRECLAKWLYGADNVKHKGGCTWYTLIDALRSINHGAIATNIDIESKITFSNLYINFYSC